MISDAAIAEMAAIAKAEEIPPGTPLAEFDSIFIEHSSHERTLSEIEAAIKVHGQLIEAPCLQITGVPGIGKSTLCKKVETKYPRVKDGRSFTLSAGVIAKCDHLPVLLVEMPDTPTRIRLMREMLMRIGDPKWASRSNDRLKPALYLYIPALGIHTVVIDDTQRAVDRNGVVMKQEIAFFLQDLHDELGVVIILVGLGRMKFFVEQDLQITRRWDAEIRIEPYKWEGGDEDESSRADFIGILMIFLNKLPLHLSCVLDINTYRERDPEKFLYTCKRFYYASAGVIGLLKKLFLRTIMIAEQRNLKVAKMELIYDAYEKAFGKENPAAGQVNPFGPNWKGALPPRLPDDTLLINPPSKRSKQGTTKAARHAELTHALTVR
ncbi:TniB family NTP-binding protein [Pseudaminobacter soli (ex Li et al. 2025)]|uniref:AAA+ ATPase domain-containing protein n=1 Tax=Pseudaminobacter soli (ex Li et al. 2025) TaxID=1295366 RepID=A0A2P7RMJ3_9HYPH|nr:TniB family NTP-binding protein [Mesorhizobium soli]PSJ51432.1 hypothetical protein C7I85_29465 [Mesorhizobium soli]